jgi:predicted AAA+ superfamily ATPase
MNREYTRLSGKNIGQALRNRRIVLLSGARQTGKTTLSKQISRENFIYRSLDNTAFLKLALEDPKNFVKNRAKTMIIDEVQKAPMLLPEIKLVVDENTRNGQYLLTGSANLQTLPTVTESLAGRIKNIRLHTLTVGEIMGKKSNFLERAYTMDFPAKIKGFDKEAILNLAFRGGYPEVVKMRKNSDAKDWHKDYVRALMLRDLKDISNIKRQDSMRELFEIMLSWSGKFMDVEGVCSKLAISKPTIESYINALISMFLFDKVPPWIYTDYDRVGRKSKLYVSDSGLMSSILEWNSREVVLNSDRSGKLIETFVFKELTAQIDFYNEYSLYQYRDREKREIDFIIERRDKSLLGIEVKAGHSVSKEDFKHLEWFRKNLTKKSFIGIVLYSGEHILYFGENMLAVPTAALWE